MEPLNGNISQMELEQQKQAEQEKKDHLELSEDLSAKSFSIVVFGASGDLAKKKTYPALMALHCAGLLPSHVKIIGFSRSPMNDEQFRSKISVSLTGKKCKCESFLKCLHYVSGQYDDINSFRQLATRLSDLEAVHSTRSNRLFYLAVPPQVFASVSTNIHLATLSQTGFNRVVIEKPFGTDLVSSEALSSHLLSMYKEEQLFRIDHYLGKEMAVVISFKEDIGLAGRAGYFDQFGIIRDVMQNHLTQMLALVAMESPVTLGAEDVRNEKVKALRYVSEVQPNDMIVGQFGQSADGSIMGYTDDPEVDSNSNTPTFACARISINNARWEGVPFILKCGKGLNQRKAEIRIQFKPPPGSLYDVSCNELVMRVQPSEAIYLKVTTKLPGLSEQLHQSELDLTYATRFEQMNAYDAYERLILDVIRGSGNLFVRNDELREAWRIFSPVLNHIEKNAIKPVKYAFGTRTDKKMCPEVLMRRMY